MTRHRLIRRAGTIALLIWLAVAMIAWTLTFSHGVRAHAHNNPPTSWPQDNRLQLGEGSFTLVMFAHPKCPCTRASLTNLQGILARAGNRAKVYVVFVVPEQTSTDWSRTALLVAAQNTPGIEILHDLNGALAAQFGVKTSGHLLLYDEGQNLVFSGGITKAPGHQGASAGAQAIVELLFDNQPNLVKTPIFGCALLRRTS